ncbi:MAG TPA: hypothetical protein VHG92_01025 [Afifellaceae bacterium]|nr:hypothetical protein [Afifellaceae bacterium]
MQRDANQDDWGEGCLLVRRGVSPAEMEEALARGRHLRALFWAGLGRSAQRSLRRAMVILGTGLTAAMSAAVRALNSHGERLGARELARLGRPRRLAVLAHSPAANGGDANPKRTAAGCRKRTISSRKPTEWSVR